MRLIKHWKFLEAIMKKEGVFAIILAILAPCLAAVAQTPPQTTPPLEPPLGGAGITATNAPAAGDDVVDVVVEGVPLPDAIQTLALQAGLNIQFDPKLINLVGPDGRVIPPPSVTQKWHNLTAKQALQALLDNYSWQMVWDPATRVGRVTSKDAAVLEPLVVSVIALHYSDPTNMVALIKPTLSTRSDIIPDKRSRQVIIRTTEKEMVAVEALVAKLDSATRQVLVEAKIVQTSKDISTAKGVDWSGTLANQHVSFGNGLTSVSQVNSANVGTPPLGTASGSVSPSGSTITGGNGSGLVSLTTNLSTITTSLLGSPAAGGGFSLNTAKGISPATAFLNADGLQAVLSFLNTDADTKTIAAPRGVALDGSPTELMVVNNIPIFEQTQSAPASGASQGLATVQPEYDLKVGTTILNEVGVKLTVTPRIAGPTNVLLEVLPEISQQLGTVSQTLNGQNNTAPSFSRTRIRTTASVPSGFTLVLGGLDQDVATKNYTKVPFLGDMPGLGYLFRSDSKTHSRQTILIFVTPTIVQDQDFQPSDTKFLQQKASSPSDLNEPPWDTGAPYDWTKPKNYGVAPEYKP
jgi:type II secretory pathway component GspD/PulD (secretin)